MDTKSKSIKYSLGTKIIAAIIMWVSIIGIVDSGVFLINNVDRIKANSYYDTHEFQWEIGRLIHNVVELNTSLIDEEHIRKSIAGPKTSNQISKDESVNEEAILNDGEIIIDEAQRNKIINEKLERLRRIKNNLSRTVNFTYYIRDIRTGNVASTSLSSTPDTIKGQGYFLYIDMYEIPHFLMYYDDISQMLSENPQELYISLREPLEPGDGFYDSFVSYSRAKELAPYAIVALIISLILLISSFIYLVWVSGRKEEDGEIILIGIDKIYNDIQSLLVLFAAIISVGAVSSINFNNFNVGLIIGLSIFSIDVLIGMTYFFSLLRQYKKGTLFKNTLIFKVLKKIVTLIRMCFNEKIFKSWILGLLLVYGFINGILFAIASFAIDGRSEMGLLVASILIVSFNVVAVNYTFKALKSLYKIMEAAMEISSGNLDYKLDKSQMSIEFLSLAENIQNIQGGLKNAVNNAIKSERMKTDLITNVSHDLKTPLTSIINYIALLKQEEINNEKVVEYLDILDDKSERLKHLIEDLIEASKASSGTLTITKEQVDLHELVLQACGEYEEKTRYAELDVRINTTKEKIFVLADGKYMWRIVENLMSNVIKYSMPKSRVYIEIENKNGYGLLVIKNMSAYPLDIDPGQLTDRFVRADESRTTEGSGLGLCIAQSLTNMQGGRFNIDIDGDLFKVIIEIPLWVEEKVI